MTYLSKQRASVGAATHAQSFNLHGRSSKINPSIHVFGGSSLAGWCVRFVVDAFRSMYVGSNDKLKKIHCHGR